jgi:GTP pyrophosphokinase
MTSPGQNPSKDWLKFVTTPRAKSKVKQYIRGEERKQGLELGTRLMEEELRRHDLPFSTLKSKKMEEILKYFSLHSLEDLYVLIGYGKISAHQVANRFAPEKVGESPFPKVVKPREVKKSVITIKGVDNVLYHIGRCCYPVPGDRIIGFISKGKGVTIHRRNCANLERLAVDRERLIEVEWNQDGEDTSQARIFVEGMDKPGLLAELSALISAAEVNIRSIKADAARDKRALIELTLEIKNREQLNALTSKMSQIYGVLNVRR